MEGSIVLSPDVVFDTSRHPVVNRMTGWEQLALAKGAARDIRLNSPSVTRSISTYEQARNNVAECVFKEVLFKAGDLPVKEAGRFERKKDLVEQRMKDITYLTNQYRKASAYRLFCVLALAAENDDKIVDARVIHDSHTLSQCQASHYRSLVVVDTIRYINKSASKRSVTEFDSLKEKLENELKRHSLKVRRGLQVLKQDLDGLTSDEHISAIKATIPQTNNSGIQLLDEAQANTECFRRFNQYLTTTLEAAINDYGLQLHPGIQVVSSTLDENGRMVA